MTTPNDLMAKLLNKGKATAPKTTAGTKPPATPSIGTKPAQAAAKPATAPAKSEGKRSPPIADDAAPWANAGCKACGGSGFNSKANPCRACDMVAGRSGNPTSLDYDLVHEDGMIMWINKEDPDDIGTFLVSEEATPAKEQTTLGAAEPEEGGDSDADSPSQDANDTEEPAEEPAEEAAHEEVSAEEEAAHEEVSADEDGAPEEEESEPDRKATSKATKTPSPAAKNSKKGLILLINCIPTDRGRKGGGRHAYDLHKFMEELRQQVLAEYQKIHPACEYVEDIPVFERRDALAKLASKLVEDLAPDMAFITGLGNGASDERTVIEVLKGKAEIVIMGVMG